MPRTAATPKEDRLSIRTNSQQKELLARAAQAQHMNVSQFVLQSSLQSAQKVIEQETQIIVSPEEYQWLCKIMDEPAKPAPRLREELKRKPVWEE